MKNNKAEAESFKHTQKMHFPLCVFNDLNIFNCLKDYQQSSIHQTLWTSTII